MHINSLLKYRGWKRGGARLAGAGTGVGLGCLGLEEVQDRKRCGAGEGWG